MIEREIIKVNKDGEICDLLVRTKYYSMMIAVSLSFAISVRSINILLVAVLPALYLSAMLCFDVLLLSCVVCLFISS